MDQVQDCWHVCWGRFAHLAADLCGRRGVFHSCSSSYRTGVPTDRVVTAGEPFSLEAARWTTALMAKSWLPLGSTSTRSEEHTSELQSRFDLVCRLLLEKKKMNRHES